MFAVTFPALAVMEIGHADLSLSQQRIPWVGFAVLGLWALHLARSPGGDTMKLVIASMGFIAMLSVIEALFPVEITTFDFTTSFGLVMMIGVLVGTLTAASRAVWTAGVAVSLAAWSITMGIVLHEPTAVIGVRAMIGVAGVVFTTVLVSKLYDELSEAITQFDRSSRLQDAIARCSEALLVQTDTFAIHEAIKALLEATDADYAYVDRTIDVEGEPGWEIIADARKKPSADYGNSWMRGSYLTVPSVHGPLAVGRAAVVHTQQLSGSERSFYESDGILSEAAVPIDVGGQFRGSIGFVQYTEDRRWSEVEIQTLWRASHMISAYWRRQDDATQLRASNESKERLLASVSHEIRTPLTAIVGLSEEIISSRTSLGDEELDELNGIIAIQSRELADLVEDLLVASRAEGGTLSIKPDVMDLRDQVERVVNVIRESYPTQKTLTLHGEGVSAWADPLRVRQVMRNLVSNAIKYGGDQIVVGVRTTEGKAQIVVADNGPGVPAHEADLIFERYYRSSQSPTQPGSVGIGLSVSRQLAELMGGTLAYVRGGSKNRFELTLPLPEGERMDALAVAAEV